MTAPKHFLDLDQFDGETLRKQLALGMAFKTGASEIRARSKVKPWP